jgi:hypothetical protein
MKKYLFMLFVLVPVSILAVAYADQKATMDLKMGDEVYACNCGSECMCNTIAKKPGDCTCDKRTVCLCVRAFLQMRCNQSESRQVPLWHGDEEGGVTPVAQEIGRKAA